MSILKRTSNFLHKIAFIIDSDVNILEMNGNVENDVGCHNVPIKTLKSIQDDWVKDRIIQ